MSPSSRNFHHRSFEDKAKNYRSRRRQELDRNLDSPDGLRTLVDSLIGDVWRARREAAKLSAAPSPALTREALARALYDQIAVGTFDGRGPGHPYWLKLADRLLAVLPPPPGLTLDRMAVALQGVDPADLRLGHDLRRPAAVILAHLGVAASATLAERVDYCGAHNVKLCRPCLDAAAVAYAGAPTEWFSPWHLGQLSETHLTPNQATVMAERIRAHFGQPKERPG